MFLSSYPIESESSKATRRRLERQGGKYRKLPIFLLYSGYSPQLQVCSTRKEPAARRPGKVKVIVRAARGGEVVEEEKQEEQGVQKAGGLSVKRFALIRTRGPASTDGIN